MKRRRGYTLTEVLIGVVIMSLAIIPMYHIFTASSKSVFRSRMSYMALQIARETLEELRQIPFDKLEDCAHASWARVEGNSFARTLEYRNTDKDTSKLAEEVDGTCPFTYPDEYKRIKTMLLISPVGATTMAEASLAKVELHVMWEETGEDAARDERETRVARTRFVTVLGRYGPGS